MSLFLSRGAGYLTNVATTIAILGTGSIGMRHYRCFNGLENVNAIAVPTRPERVTELQAEGINAAPQVPDDAEGIVIATDTGRHLADWQQFQDRYCLIEKPLSGDPSPDLETLVSQTQGRAFTACCLRFHRTLTEFKNLVSERQTPDFVAIRCSSFLPDWRPDRDYRTLYSAQAGQGGALRELIHEIDYAGWIFGWPTSVQGNLCPATTIEIADEESAKFIWQSEAINIIFELDLATNPTTRMALAKFHDNSLVLDLVKQAILIQNNLKVENIEFSEDRDAMYIRQAEAFIRAIKGQGSKPLATAAEGLKALQVCEAVRLSHQTGKPVTL